MAEMANTSEYHSDISFISGSYNFLIAHGPPWLNNGGYTSFSGGIDSISEREECIGRHY
jgi:hypothetical protein